jgi:hypothetical protein
MGIVPPAGHQEVATGTSVPVVYHGGSVMRGVTIHTIFWAPSGFHFDGPPSAKVLSYERLIQQFFTDVAHDSGTTSNVFSTVMQYGDRAGPGRYAISYSASVDSIDATDPYPSRAHQCVSPSGIATCVTDLELQREIDRVIRSHAPAARGLHDIWFVFLPPDVDTCSSASACGTNSFAGYHSLSSFGRGHVVYSVVPDPLIEATPRPGLDPQGNPEAEAAIDTIAHETVEAITDPEGVGWMDPNGFEAGDKCESGPQQGTPLGFAPDGSPYNQVINGDQYLIQGMWANAGSGCAQRSTAGSPTRPLATVRMKQFSSVISGNIGTRRRGVSVAIALARAGSLVAIGVAITGADGGWRASLSSIFYPGFHAVGDDRDEILIRYGRYGPKPDLIETGDGGNPFTAAGWTGWFDLDNGYAIGARAILLGPCSQTGVLGLRINGAPTPPPVEQCETESDVSVVHTRHIGAGTSLTMSSEDNRAVWLGNPSGALVTLTVPLGEPGSVSTVNNAGIPFTQTGFPRCTADLQRRSVSCNGLVPGTRYALTRRRDHAVRHASADFGGSLSVQDLRIRGGDVITLTNRARRTLTTLHVAHLRVDVIGQQSVIASGSCEPGDYYGATLTSIPTSASIGVPGAGRTGTICPVTGDPTGLSISHIQQTDDRSGGQTRTEVPSIEAMAPIANETLYGPFVAFAQIGLPGPNGSIVGTSGTVALTISRPGSRRAVFRARNVAVAQGVAVDGLARGLYLAKWVLSDSNGDTRTVQTRFVQEG